MMQCFLLLSIASLCFVAKAFADDIDEVVTVNEGEDATLPCPHSVSPEQVSRTLIIWNRTGQKAYRSSESLLTMSPTFPEFNEVVNGKMRFEVETPGYYYNLHISNTSYKDTGLYACTLQYYGYLIKSYDILLKVTPSQPISVDDIQPEDRQTVVFDYYSEESWWGRGGVTLPCAFDVNSTQIYWVRMHPGQQQEMLMWEERRTTPDGKFEVTRQGPASSQLFIGYCCYDAEYAGDYVCVAEATGEMKLLHVDILTPTTPTTTTRRWHRIRWEN